MLDNLLICIMTSSIFHCILSFFSDLSQLSYIEKLQNLLEPEYFLRSPSVSQFWSHQHSGSVLYLIIYKQYFSLVKKKNTLENMSPYISKSTSFIMRNLNQPLNPEIIADAVGISKDYLLHIFPQYLHCTVMDYIYRSRIEASCNMLKFSDYSIGRIAFYFQFKTQSHFSVVFKKYKGFLPAEYRKSNKPQNFEKSHWPPSPLAHPIFFFTISYPITPDRIPNTIPPSTSVGKCT